MLGIKLIHVSKRGYWGPLVVLLYCVLSKSQVTATHVNTLRPRQNGRHFADNILNIFLNENVWISRKISLRFVPKVPMDNIPALVQIMAHCRSSNKPLSEPVVLSLLIHDIYVSLGLSDLRVPIDENIFIKSLQFPNVLPAVPNTDNETSVIQYKNGHANEMILTYFLHDNGLA